MPYPTAFSCLNYYCLEIIWPASKLLNKSGQCHTKSSAWAVQLAVFVLQLSGRVNPAFLVPPQPAKIVSLPTNIAKSQRRLPSVQKYLVHQIHRIMSEPGSCSDNLSALLSLPGELRNTIYQSLDLPNLANLTCTSKFIHQEVNGMIWETWFSIGSLQHLGVSGEPQFCLHTASLVQNLVVPIHVWSQLWARVLIFWLRIKKFFPSLKRLIVQDVPTGDGETRWVENVYLELVKSCPAHIKLGWMPAQLPKPWSYQDSDDNDSDFDETEFSGGYSLDGANPDVAMPDMFLRSFLEEMNAEDGDAWLRRRRQKLHTVQLPPYGTYSARGKPLF
jgi:hypothetical protein